jgi:hypothetical protein
MSRLRRPFLGDRYFFVNVNLPRSKGKLGNAISMSGGGGGRGLGCAMRNGAVRRRSAGWRILCVAGAIAALGFAGLTPIGRAQEAEAFERLTPRPPVFRASDFRLAADQTLPEVESYQQVVFSGSVSGIPKDEGLDRLTAPPYTVLLRQSFALLDRSSGALYYAGQASGGASIKSPAALVWEPGRATISTETSLANLQVEQVALRSPQGFVFRVVLQNPGREKRALVLATVEQPILHRPREWTFGAQWPRTYDPDSFVGFFGTVTAEPPAPASVGADVVVHDAGDGAVAIGFAGASAAAASSASGALNLAAHGKSGGDGAASTLYRTIELAPGESRAFFVVLAVSTSRGGALDAARKLLSDPQAASAAARELMDADIQTFLTRLPALSHPDPRVVRFYQHAALQLLYARWKVGKTFVLDPWYASLGLDSGGMDSYAWDFGYAAIPLTLLDPAGMRAMLVAMLNAPLTEHFDIEPVRGEGTGKFYSYNPYTYTSAVDNYIRATGDRSILRERMRGKTLLEWLIDMAQFGESDRDPDHNHLLDYGDDDNLLEIKTTGSGPGYIHEVPSPNGERSYVYETVADLLEEEHDAEHAALIPKFRQSAADVRRAINEILWMEDVGWYGTRQADGTVAAIYSIQIFDLLRIPGVVPPERARRLVAHLNEGEFLGPWGPRSLSIKDRLWDWTDHDWSGPMTYIGDGPQLVADLYQAGFAREAWEVLERMLWWPDHLAVYPQGIANDDYTSRFPQSKPFGGRISAGRTNEISGCVGVEAIIRGLFGVKPERDGSIGFSAGRLPQDGPMALAYPFRGKIWTITQRPEGMDATRNDGFAATLWREDGSLRFSETERSMVIRASARSGGGGRMTLKAPYLVRKFRLKTADSLVVRVANHRIAFRTANNAIVLDLTDLGGPGADIEITGSDPATPTQAATTDAPLVVGFFLGARVSPGVLESGNPLYA